MEEGTFENESLTGAGNMNGKHLREGSKTDPDTDQMHLFRESLWAKKLAQDSITLWQAYALLICNSLY
eukprot:1968968-Amphidinium_carterae.1